MEVRDGPLYLPPRFSLLVSLCTLEILIRGNVIIRKAQKAIQADDCRPRRRSSSRFPVLTPTRVSFELANSRGKKKKKRKKVYIYIHIFTYGGIYMYVQWGWGLESGKLYDATVDGWEESSEPIFLLNVQMAPRKSR